MELIKPSFEIEQVTGLNLIERAGRTCYKSEHKMHDKSSSLFVRNIVRSGHESVLEHSMLSVRFIVDRGVTHELVRHRLIAFSQESTRYCNYSGGVTFIIPPWVDIKPGEYLTVTDERLGGKLANITWAQAMLNAEMDYKRLIELGWLAQQARAVLPNSTKTEIVCTANFREWRHIFKLRALGLAGKPHPQMEEIMLPLLLKIQDLIPEVFDDLVK